MIPLLPHQAELVEDEITPFLVLVGGLGSAKTTALAWKALTLAMLNPGLPGMLLEQTHSQLKDILYPAFGVRGEEDGVLARAGIRYTMRWADRDLILHLPQGDTPIWFRSADRPLPGSSIAWVGLDEVGLLPWKSIKQALARVRHPSARVRQRVLVGTPEGFNHFHSYAEGKQRRELERVARKEGRPPPVRLIRARTDDNPFLPPGYVEESLSGFDDSELEAYRNGLFVPPSGRVYTRFARERHVVDCTQERARPTHVFCDFNVGKMVWLVASVESGRVHVVDEVVRENTDTYEHTRATIQRLAELTGLPPDVAARRVTAITDAAGSARKTSAKKSDTQILRDHGIRVEHPRANPYVEDRVHSVQRALELGLLVVDPRCHETITAVEQQPRGKDGAPKKGTGPDALDHAADALGYGVSLLHPATRPRGNARIVSSYS